MPYFTIITILVGYIKFIADKAFSRTLSTFYETQIIYLLSIRTASVTLVDYIITRITNTFCNTAYSSGFRDSFMTLVFKQFVRKVTIDAFYSSCTILIAQTSITLFRLTQFGTYGINHNETDITCNTKMMTLLCFINETSTIC